MVKLSADSLNTQHALGNGLTHATTTDDEYILEFVCYGVFHLALSCVIVFYLENILRNEIFAILPRLEARSSSKSQRRARPPCRR